jgi:hypothetical protein
MAAVSETAEPEMSPKRKLATTLEAPSPPRIRPTRTWAKSTSSRAMPAVCMSFPDRMSSGMAMSAKMLTPLYTCSAPVMNEMSPTSATYVVAINPRDSATGTPMSIGPNRARARISPLTPPPGRTYWASGRKTRPK